MDPCGITDPFRTERNDQAARRMWCHIRLAVCMSVLSLGGIIALQTPRRAPQFGQNMAEAGIWNWQFGHCLVPVWAAPGGAVGVGGGACCSTLIGTCWEGTPVGGVGST